MITSATSQRLFAVAFGCLLAVAGLLTSAQALRATAGSAPDDPHGLVWQFQAVETSSRHVYLPLMLR